MAPRPGSAPDDADNIELPRPRRAKRVVPRGGVGHVPPVEVSERARTYVDAYGTSRARAMLGGLSAEAIARVVAGLPVQRGTILVVERALAERDRAARARGEDGT